MHAFSWLGTWYSNRRRTLDIVNDFFAVGAAVRVSVSDASVKDSSTLSLPEVGDHHVSTLFLCCHWGCGRPITNLSGRVSFCLVDRNQPSEFGAECNQGRREPTTYIQCQEKSELWYGRTDWNGRLNLNIGSGSDVK